MAAATEHTSARQPPLCATIAKYSSDPITITSLILLLLKRIISVSSCGGGHVLVSKSDARAVELGRRSLREIRDGAESRARKLGHA